MKKLLEVICFLRSKQRVCGVPPHCRFQQNLRRLFKKQRGTIQNGGRAIQLKSSSSEHRANQAIHQSLKGPYEQFSVSRLPGGPKECTCPEEPSEHRQRLDGWGSSKKRWPWDTCVIILQMYRPSQTPHLTLSLAKLKETECQGGAVSGQK